MLVTANHPNHPTFTTTTRHLLALGVMLLLAAAASAAVPTEAAERAAVIGQPASLMIQPENITLTGPRAMQQIAVTGKYADGSVRALTPFCEWTPEASGVFTITPDGFMQPQQNGTTSLVVKAGSQTAKVPVTVKDFDKPRPISFRQDVIAAFNVGGCNAGACHGTPSGKGGFKLSLRGYDPAADYLQLTRDVFGRRTSAQDADASLILQKSLGRGPHEGGPRYAPSSIPAGMVRGWLAEGLSDDPSDLPALKGIPILPGPRVVAQPARWQQLAVIASFADGSSRDVTRLTVFSSSDAAVADVGNTGLVQFNQSGEVA